MPQIKYYADRQLNKHLIERLATSEYIKRHENLIIVGTTGSDKSYIACALGVEAYNATLKVMYIILPDLLAELDLAKVQGNYRKRINQYIKYDLLILDEWLLVGTNNANSRIFWKYWKRDIVFNQHSNVHSFLPVLLLFQYSLIFVIANSLYQQYVLEHQLNLNDKI